MLSLEQTCGQAEQPRERMHDTAFLPRESIKNLNADPDPWWRRGAMGSKADGGGGGKWGRAAF